MEPGEVEVLKKLIERYFEEIFNAKAKEQESYQRSEGRSATKPQQKASQEPENSVNNDEEEAPF